jgi:hypothetical protein
MNFKELIMRMRIGRNAGLAILTSLIMTAVACNEKTREEEVKPNAVIIMAHEDLEGLSNYVRPPVPILKARRVVAPLANGRSDIGPTDLTAYILVHVEESDWPAWLAAFGEPKRRTAYHLPTAIAEALLPADLLATLPLDSNGRLIDGVFYDPKDIAVSGNRGILAIRLGTELLLVFTST